MSIVKREYPDKLVDFQPQAEFANGQGLEIRNESNDRQNVTVLESNDPVLITTGTNNDTITGGDSELGNDTLSGGAGDDLVRGRAGNDIIDGGAGNDNLEGGAGNDILEIGTGDTVSGGAGADTIRLDLSAGFDANNPPVITDLASGEDKIAILGQEDAKLSYDSQTKELLLDGQPIIQLDANVALSPGDLLTSTGENIPFEEPVPILYKLSGTVYNDTNAPGSNAIEATDKPLAGVEVQLFAADANDQPVGTVIATATSNADGFYEFTDLADGNYVVKETQPAGYDSVTDKDGGNPDQILTTIAGADSVGNDFLEELTPVEAPVLYKLSGTVYNDTNAPGSNAIEATDKPIAGVKVQLFAADAKGQAVGNAIDTATTDAKGLYSFADLADGDYVVKETQPAGYDSVTDKDGGDSNQILTTIAGADSVGNDFLEELTPVDPVDPTNEPTKVYQFVNPSLGSYFYTVDEYEKSVIAETLDNYELQEVEAIRTLEENEVDPITGAESEEVYRFFNTSTGSHLYTTSEFERDSILENLGNYSLDDNMFFAYETEVEGSIDVHRFYNATEDVHIFTHNDTEIADMMADSEQFNDEGIAFYVMPDAIS
jgi:hypothetical protein